MRSIAIAAIAGGGAATIAGALSVRRRGHAIASLVVEAGHFLVQPRGALVRVGRALERRTRVRELASGGVMAVPRCCVPVPGQFSCPLLGLHGALFCLSGPYLRLCSALAGWAAAIDATAPWGAHSLACTGWGASAETLPSLPAISRMTP